MNVNRRERYKLFSGEDHIGYFNVNYTKFGRELSADIFKPVGVFVLMADEDGYANPFKIGMWIQERTIPRTRIGIDSNLRQMGLSEYDELEILKFTQARHTHDDFSIDFSQSV